MLPAPYHQGNNEFLKKGATSIPGIHQLGWSKDWEKWLKTQRDKGIPVTRESILARLEKMKSWRKYKAFFQDDTIGKPATMSFEAWQAYRKEARAAAEIAAKRKMAQELAQTAEAESKLAREVASKAAAKAAQKAGKKGAGALARRVGKIVKKVPKLIPGIATIAAAIGWGLDVHAKGFKNGTANTLADAIPVVGNYKVAVELWTGEDMIPDLGDERPGLQPGRSTGDKPPLGMSAKHGRQTRSRNSDLNPPSANGSGPRSASKNSE
jgi:hypothetical protein